MEVLIPHQDLHQSLGARSPRMDHGRSVGSGELGIAGVEIRDIQSALRKALPAVRHRDRRHVAGKLKHPQLTAKITAAARVLSRRANSSRLKSSCAISTCAWWDLSQSPQSIRTNRRRSRPRRTDEVRNRVRSTPSAVVNCLQKFESLVSSQTNFSGVRRPRPLIICGQFTCVIFSGCAALLRRSREPPGQSQILRTKRPQALMRMGDLAYSPAGAPQLTDLFISADREIPPRVRPPPLVFSPRTDRPKSLISSCRRWAPELAPVQYQEISWIVPLVAEAPCLYIRM